MGMASLQFYKNKYRYPKYSNAITPYGIPLPCTPVGVNLKSGTLRVKGTMTDFMSCNYLALTRDLQTIYAWIEDVQFLTEDSFLVSYSVDAWRTYKSKIDLGTQFIARRPETSNKKDNMLGASVDYPEVTSTIFPLGMPSKRVFVVQVRGAGDEPFSRTPVQPNPYQFFLREYDCNNWTSDSSLTQLLTLLQGSAEPINIVTMYSIPYMDLTELSTIPLPVKTADGTTTVGGFKFLDQDPTPRLTLTTTFSLLGTMDDLLRTDHSVQLVIPEAGVMNIPDELLVKEELRLRMDVDLFSGACNYMLVSETGDIYDTPYSQSVRGSSISSIPIVSDPLDTYLSQNQNALATSLIGDVASIVAGGAMVIGTGGLAGGAGMVASAFGGSSAISGINNIISRQANQADIANKYSNPPAFLGTALASTYNQLFWVVVTKKRVENAELVHTNFGYPWGIVDSLVFPISGFIQTEGCAVSSTDGSVPKWALDEINHNFNSGILVY